MDGTYYPQPSTSKECITMAVKMMADEPIDVSKAIVKHIVETDHADHYFKDANDPLFQEIVSWSMVCIQEVAEAMQEHIMVTFA
jgi:hypothetical protein